MVVKDDELGKRVYFAQNRLGGVLAPNECDSVRRGIQTLALRMDRQQENARAISSYLLLHPLVKSVHYPGLPGHEYELASNGLKGGGAVLSFEVVPGVDPADVLDNLHIFRLAVSLGAVESLAELPCRMTHFELPREERLKVGITPTSWYVSRSASKTSRTSSRISVRLSTSRMSTISTVMPARVCSPSRNTYMPESFAIGRDLNINWHAISRTGQGKAPPVRLVDVCGSAPGQAMVGSWTALAQLADIVCIRLHSLVNFYSGSAMVAEPTKGHATRPLKRNQRRE